MALGYPVSTPQDFAQLLIYACKGLKAHYGNQYEVELDNGPQNWISEEVHDAIGRPIYHCRMAIRQTFDRELGKQWNHCDWEAYNLRTIYAGNSDASLVPANSRDYLKWAIYAALGLKAAYPNVEHELELFSENRAYKQFRPVCFTNATFTDGGLPLLILEAWIPQLPTRDEGTSWNHVDFDIFQEPAFDTVPATYASPD